MGAPIVIGASGDVNHFAGEVHIQEKLRLCQELSLETSRGAKFGIKTLDIASTTLSGGTTNLATQIPAGALVFGVVFHVTTLIAGATSWKAGDGTDDDIWGATLALAAGTKTTSANFTAAPKTYATATNIVLTAVGGGASFSAGVVRGAIVYADVSALLS